MLATAEEFEKNVPLLNVIFPAVSVILAEYVTISTKTPASKLTPMESISKSTDIVVPTSSVARRDAVNASCGLLIVAGNALNVRPGKFVERIFPPMGSRMILALLPNATSKPPSNSAAVLALRIKSSNKTTPTLSFAPSIGVARPTMGRVRRLKVWDSEALNWAPKSNVPLVLRKSTDMFRSTASATAAERPFAWAALTMEVASEKKDWFLAIPEEVTWAVPNVWQVMQLTVSDTPSWELVVIC